VCESNLDEMRRLKSLQIVDISDKGTSAAVEGGPRGDAKIAVNCVFLAKSVEVRNCFGELVGWLDPSITPKTQQLSYHRRRPFTAMWGQASNAFCWTHVEPDTNGVRDPMTYPLKRTSYPHVLSPS